MSAPAGETLFVTGASGFVGRQLLPLLHATPARCLQHRRPVVAAAEGLHRIVPGDLTDPASYRRHLAGVSTVIHLAAVTGSARAERHHAVNLEGTRRLAQAARDAGVGRLVLVSTIAATFPDRRHYHYAAAKAAAEEAVRTAGVDWVIIRPTLVLGPDSPQAAALRRLVAGPVGLMFGSASALTQPIDVRDLARVIHHVLTRFPTGEVVEVGGGETLPLVDLLHRMRRAVRGSDSRLLPIPLTPARTALAALERWLPNLPVTAGQLAVFHNDSVAAPHPLVDELRPAFHDIATMLGAGSGSG